MNTGLDTVNTGGLVDVVMAIVPYHFNWKNHTFSKKHTHTQTHPHMGQASHINIPTILRSLKRQIARYYLTR